MLLDVYDALVRFVCLGFAVAFVISFSRVTWERTPEGRQLMQFGLMVIVFLSLSCAVVIFGRQSWYDLISRLAFSWMGWLLYRQLHLQRAAQKEYQRLMDLESETPESNTNSDSNWERGQNA